jgi:hypothetical protein
MLMLHAHVGKSFIEGVFFYGGFGVNISMERLCVQLGLFKPKPIPYNLHMVNQTTAKPLGLIKDLKIYVHGIPYTFNFIIIQINALDFAYFMLLG